MIAYIKKHTYKDTKETTHGEIGEKQHTSLYIYENKYNVCHK